MGRALPVVIAVVVLAGAGAAGFVLLRRQPPRPHPASAPSAHRAGIDRAMAAMTAMYDAPEGKTPCESAYLALEASQNAARTANAPAVVLRLAPRDDFFARCGALPPATQVCLVPKYKRAHHEECEKARPSPEQLKPLFELTHAPSAQARDEHEPPPASAR